MAGEHGGEVIDGELEDMPSNGNGKRGGALATVRQPAMQQIRTQYTTAMRCEVPRDLAKVQERCVREAALAGEDFMYSWTQGKGSDRTTIEGVSIDGAMILCRNFGNCVPEIDIVEDAPTHWIFRATFIDFETGMTLPRLFRKSKSGVHGKHDAERKLDIALQIGQSKAQRNVIVKAMPTYLVNAAIDASKRAAAAAIKDLPKAIADAVATFGKAPLSVSVDELETFLGAPKDQWNKADIVKLRATYRAIIDRQTTVEQEFRPQADEPPAVTTPDKTPAPAATATPEPAASSPETNAFTGEPNAAPQETKEPAAETKAPATETTPQAPAAVQAAETALAAETQPEADAALASKTSTKKKADREPGVD